MNKKVKTITTWLAAAIFLLALAINIKVTLDDPFVMLSDEAIAQTASDTTSTSTGVETPVVCLLFGVLEYGKALEKDGKCYADRAGEDLFEGYTGQCVNSPGNCHPASCRTLDGCYTMPY